MWTKPKADIKCPHGDCAHYKKAPDELPCRDCICNRAYNSMRAAFRYTPKAMHRFNSDKQKGDQS